MLLLFAHPRPAGHGLASAMLAAMLAAWVVAALCAAGAALAVRRAERLSRELGRAQAAVQAGQLTAGLSHELKNALTILLGYAELAAAAAQRNAGEQQVLERLAAVQQQARRTAGALRRFMGRASGEPEPVTVFGLSAALEDTLELLRPLSRLSDRALTVGAIPLEVQVRGSADALHHALVELVLNALAQSASAVSVEVEVDGSRALVAVQNDGRGVNQREQAGLFEPFAPHGPGGTGLGLFAARQALRACGGELRLARASPARFEIALPLATPAA